MEMEAENTTNATTESFGFDYKTVETEQRYAPETLDCYEAFGWELRERSESILGIGTSFSLRRPRRVKNKEQINRLQMRMEDGLNHIKVMERQKTQKASTVAIIIGVMGALFFGGGMSIFMVQFDHLLWHYIVGGILAAIGLGLGLLGYVSYLKIRDKKTKIMNEQIEKKRDEIAVICEDAQRLLA